MDLRYTALDLAIRSMPTAAPSDIVGVAEKFLAFLSGADKQPAAAKPAAKAETKKVEPAADTKTAEPETLDAGTGEPVTDAAEIPPYTGDVEDLKKACTGLAAAKGAAALKGCFEKVGAGKWSEVAETKYEDLWNAVQKAAA